MAKPARFAICIIVSASKFLLFGRSKFRVRIQRSLSISAGVESRHRDPGYEARAHRSVLFSVAMGTLLPTGGHALGLSEIRVHSALNQPLEAEVEVYGARPGEAEELVVSLADSQSFREAGLDRLHFLTTLRFVVARRSDGRPYIKAFTLGDVREPLLTFLVEVDWAKGRIMREFAVLLDPPGMAGRRALQQGQWMAIPGGWEIRPSPRRCNNSSYPMRLRAWTASPL
jgi:Tfp pilus assembly protein FimV